MEFAYNRERPMYYILEGQKIVPVDDVITWAIWLENTHHTGVRKVKCEFVAENVQVSTVFIGLDEQFGQGKPLIFESKVFGGPLDGWKEKYATWAGAEFGHGKVVEKVRAAIKSLQ